MLARAVRFTPSNSADAADRWPMFCVGRFPGDGAACDGRHALEEFTDVPRSLDARMSATGALTSGALGARTSAPGARTSAPDDAMTAPLYAGEVLSDFLKRTLSRAITQSRVAVVGGDAANETVAARARAEGSRAAQKTRSPAAAGEQPRAGPLAPCRSTTGAGPNRPTIAAAPSKLGAASAPPRIARERHRGTLPRIRSQRARHRTDPHPMWIDRGSSGSRRLPWESRLRERHRAGRPPADRNGGTAPSNFRCPAQATPSSSLTPGRARRTLPTRTGAAPPRAARSTKPRPHPRRAGSGRRRVNQSGQRRRRGIVRGDESRAAAAET